MREDEDEPCRRHGDRLEPFASRRRSKFRLSAAVKKRRFSWVNHTPLRLKGKVCATGEVTDTATVRSDTQAGGSTLVSERGALGLFPNAPLLHLRGFFINRCTKERSGI